MGRESCNLWFHPRKYVANNIQYRIASGKAIASYKNAQTFLMKEVAFNPYHEFSVVAKEILLLKYDIWFDYLCEIEQYFLVDEGKFISKDNIEILISLSNDRVKYYEFIMGDNPSIFHKKFLEIWLETHKVVYNHLIICMKNLEGLNKAEGFSLLTEKIINIMNHTLYELYEVDILMYSNESLVFNYDSLCNDISLENNACLILEKMKIFEKVRESKNLKIKVYDDAKIPFERSLLKKGLEEKNIKYKVQ
jgi:hypothetical protein